MRFMILLKADKNTEAGVPPSTELIAAMMKYNEELTKAGVLLAGEGLQPSSKGTRIKFSAGKQTVIDGPFPEPMSKPAISGICGSPGLTTAPRRRSPARSRICGNGRAIS